MKRRFLLGASALAAALAMTGVARAQDSGLPPLEQKDQYTVGFAQSESNNPWRIAETKSLRDEAAKRGIDLVVTDAQGQTAKQVSDVEDLIARRVNLILLAPREYEGLAPALQSAKAANIPVILVDRAAAGEAGKDYVTLLASNFIEQGQRAAEWLAQHTNGKAQIVELSGTPGASVAIDRAKGFRDGIAKYPDMKIIASQTGNFTRAEGERVMQNLAQSLGAKITAVYAHNDEMALGAIAAIKAAGKVPGKDILVNSIDGEKDGIKAIAAGSLVATVECNPRFGPIAFKTMQQYAQGQAVSTVLINQDRLFNKDNAQQNIANAF